jgi:hypothetical protein
MVPGPKPTPGNGNASGRRSEPKPRIFEARPNHPLIPSVATRGFRRPFSPLSGGLTGGWGGPCGYRVTLCRRCQIQRPSSRLGTIRFRRQGGTEAPESRKVLGERPPGHCVLLLLSRRSPHSTLCEFRSVLRDYPPTSFSYLTVKDNACALPRQCCVGSSRLLL